MSVTLSRNTTRSIRRELEAFFRLFVLLLCMVFAAHSTMMAATVDSRQRDLISDVLTRRTPLF